MDFFILRAKGASWAEVYHANKLKVEATGPAYNVDTGEDLADGWYADLPGGHQLGPFGSREKAVAASRRRGYAA